MSHQIGFHNFFDRWLQRQQSYLDQLIDFSSSPNSHENPEQQRDLIIERVLSHYQEYYKEKARTASEDVFSVFSAPWLSSFEQTFLWIAGFKPMMILCLVKNIVGGDLTAEQLQIMKRMEAETSRAEKELMETIAPVQESVAAPPLLTVARRVGRLMDGEISNLDGAIEKVKKALLGVLQRADELRASTVTKAVEVLSPDQKVKFLVGAAEFQLRIRRWGVERDSKRTTS